MKFDAQTISGFIPKKADSTSTNPFWRAVNNMALDHRDAWVVDLFGADAVYQPGTGAWRISSAALERNLEEDLSIAPSGIQDFGTEEGLTAIDLVKWRLGGTAKSAALWLCQRCSVKPEDLGFDPDYDSLKFFTCPARPCGHGERSTAGGRTARTIRRLALAMPMPCRLSPRSRTG